MHAKTHGTAFMYNRERMLLNRLFPNPADTGAAVKAKQRNLLIGSFYQKAGKASLQHIGIGDPKPVFQNDELLCDIIQLKVKLMQNIPAKNPVEAEQIDVTEAQGKI